MSSQREIITINIGGCGLNLGAAQLQQFAAEAGIGMQGDKEHRTRYDSRVSTMFEETTKQKYFARALFVDSDPNSIHSLALRYNYASLIPSENMVAGKEDFSMNFAKGNGTGGRSLIDKVNDQLRLMVECCGRVQGFLINHSVSGGTGGGLGALILERLAVDYRRRCKFGVHVYMDETNGASSSLGVYNTLLAQHSLLDHTEVSLMFDNKAMHKLCRNALQLQSPKHANYTKLITKMVGDLTATTRFGINETMNTINMDIVPFPRLHFLTSSIYPLVPASRPDAIYDDDVEILLKESCLPKHFSLDVPDFDGDRDRTMTMSFTMRGPEMHKYIIQATEAERFLHQKQSTSPLRWTEWGMGKAMMKIVQQKAAQLKGDDMAMADKQVAMMTNNTCVAHFLKERVAKHFDKLYAKKCYVHHFVGDGMYESELAEARENLAFLEKDYLAVTSIGRRGSYD